jgi:DNA-binding MarR family transcriptional regulator
MRQVRRLSRMMHSRTKPLGVDATIAQLSVLRTLEEFGPMRASDLARETGLTASSITGQLDRLEAEGYVERRRSREDRREVTVHLTPPALSMLREAHERIEAEVAQLFSNLSDEELETIESIIAKLIG